MFSPDARTTHLIVLADIHGDGTPDNTTIDVNDPWPGGQGRINNQIFNAIPWICGNVVTIPNVDLHGRSPPQWLAFEEDGPCSSF